MSRGCRWGLFSVLSAATSVWIPVTTERLFNFLRNEGLRAEWDILSNGGPMQQMIRIAKGQLDGNSVSLLRATEYCIHSYFLIAVSLLIMNCSPVIYIQQNESMWKLSNANVFFSMTTLKH
jgi:hypothetical protein